MARGKAVHKLSDEDSAKTPTREPTRETTLVPQDGPEGYPEYEPTAQLESDRIKAAYAQSPSQSSKSIIQIHENHDPATERSAARSVAHSPAAISEYCVVKLSPYGSPFAYVSCQNKHEFFKGLLSESTRALFDQVVAEAPDLRRRICENLGLTDTGDCGQFCALKKRKTKSTKLDLYHFGPDKVELALPMFVGSTAANAHPANIASGSTADPLDAGSGSADESFKADKRIDVVRIRKNRENDYFVMSHEFDHVYINDAHMDPNMVAGPLPDFAVLEFGDISYFWWRTAAALDCMPNLKRKRAREDDSTDSAEKVHKGDSDISPNSSASSSLNSLWHGSVLPTTPSPTPPSPKSDPQVSSDSNSWLDEYRRRVKVCEERPVKFSPLITDFRPPHQFPPGEMHYADVILAIGAVWLGLKNANLDFAYANSNFFTFARSERMVGMQAVNGPNHFIIPLFFNKELQPLSPEAAKDTAKPLEPVFSAFQRGEEEANQENRAAFEKTKQADPGNRNRPPPSLQEQENQNKNHKGGIGHFMLAIAEKVNRDSPNTIKTAIAKRASVRLRFMDSANEIVNEGVIRRAGRNTVRNSGWLGDIWPYFDANEEIWVEVLSQTGNRCGEHTVLNAWAYMLEIPLATTRERSFGPSFYAEVRRLIDLALRGQLDSLTIQAWMQHSKYAVDEPISQLQQAEPHNPDLSCKLRNMETVALNEEAFNEIVNDILAHEQAIIPSRADMLGAIPVVPGGTIVEQTRHATETGATKVPTSQALVPSFSNTRNNSAGFISPTKRPPPAFLSPAYTSRWKQSLIRGLSFNKTLRSKNLSTTKSARKKPSTIPKSSNLADYDVVLGIAPIWEGLKRLGRPDIDFTFAGLDTFCPRDEEQHLGAVGRWSRFIMPLFFSQVRTEELANQGKHAEPIKSLGHLLLCVAELVNDQPMTVRLEIFESRPHTISNEAIILRAQELVKSSGWLGENRSETPVEYTVVAKRVPHQVGQNTCGLHVILNAWAVMLGIPIHPSTWRRGRTERNQFDAVDAAFLSQGLELVNLALAGFMDSATIQAFFNVHGYSAEQRHGDPARAVIPVNAVGMNQDKLLRTLQKRHWGSLLEAARAENRSFPSEDMAALMQQNLNEDQAWTALVMGQGNVDRAMQWHFDSDEPGKLPKPEDALSPKTPDRGKKF